MTIDEKELAILKTLIESNNYLTTYELATLTNISQRTIRTKISNIKKILLKHDYKLMSKPGKGYYIPNKNYKTLLSLQEIIYTFEQKKENIVPIYPVERQNYIIYRLIFSDNYIKLDDLAEELLISRSTINNDIISVKKSIEKYDLLLVKKPNYGLKIVGLEDNLRKAMYDTYFTYLASYDNLYNYLDNVLNTNHKLLKILNKYGIQMSDIALADFFICLSITMARISNKHAIDTNIKQPDNATVEHKASNEIVKFLSKKYNITFNQNEINNITIIILCKRSTKGMSKSTSNEISTLVDQCINTIFDKTRIVFNDSRFYRTLALYLNATLIRQRYNEKIRHPLYNTFKTKNPLAYYLANCVSKILVKNNHKILSQSELAFFSTIFSNAIINKRKKLINILLISGLGYSSEKLLQYQIETTFSNKINKIISCQYNNLNTVNLNDYDFIISTMLLTKNFPIPIINISPQITKDDLTKIHNFLLYTYGNENLILNFFPPFYKNHLPKMNFNELVYSLYSTIKNQYESLSETFKSHLLIDENYILTNFNNRISIINLLKPFNNNNNILVYIFKKPTIIKNNQSQIILLTSLANNHDLYQILINKLGSLATNDSLFNNIINHQKYCNFIDILNNNF